ncbi:MAG TPA: hypothetical protein DET40_12025 [Lentisphaeria bacterium]|nr:MAG: hypothetical protein A2X45_16770 [Lentisphaerae bacterium GWF2_50_93]HCE44267.1 hypothetical protein [Lentisphaeria bacterium]
MNLTDELRKLAELRQEGHLTDQEFADAKQKLIAEGNSPQTGSDDDEDLEGTEDGDEKTYQASRWSSGNMFFPDRLILSGDGMLFQKRALFGSSEEHINYRAVASISVQNGILLSDVSIETSGGSQPIFLNGLWKSEAREIQDTIRMFQRKSGKAKS